MKKEFYLFDFDGVLVDSMPFWAGTHMQMLTDAGIPVPDGFVETITPLGNINTAKHVISLGVKLTFEEYLDTVFQKYLEGYTTHIALKENVKEALEQLKSRGVSVNVLTASTHLYVDPCLKRNGIYDLFDNVWTVEDFSLTKAQPEIYHEAAKKLGAEVGDCTMLDDNLTVITTAKGAGMKTVAVYDDTSKSVETRMKETADRYIYNFKELI